MPSIVPDKAKLDPLRVPILGDNGSGYKFVYHSGLDDFGRDAWVGRVKHHGKLVTVPGSRSHHPHVSAMVVADWFAERFGPWWVDYVRRSDQPPYEVRYDAARKVWTARVWIAGEPEDVVRLALRPRGGWRFTDEVETFGTQNEARAGVTRYLARTCGIFEHLLAFRKHAPGEFGLRPAKGR